MFFARMLALALAAGIAAAAPASASPDQREDAEFTKLIRDTLTDMVLYALRPFWRWQTQGSYFLGFNALLNWDHLDAGAPAPEATKAAGGG